LLEKNIKVFCFPPGGHRLSSEKKALSFLKKRNKRLLFLWCMTASVPAAAQSVALEGPQRDFGYVVGDVIGTTVTITSQKDSRLDTRSLPVPGPLNALIELRRIDVLASDARKTVLRLEYQNFAAPDQVMQAELPGYDLRFAAGVAHVPAWPFHVSPLRIAQRAVQDPAALHGNLPVPPLPVQPAVTRMLLSAAIAAIAGFVFAGMQGWLPGLGRRSRPFAIAARRIGRLAPAQAEAALREMLHAFDVMAGRHLFREDIESLLAHHAIFSGLRTEIIRLFDLAQKTLFAPAPSLREDDFAGIARLAKALRRAERRW